MSLIALKQYMMRVKISSLSTIAATFKKEPELVRCLLRHWICKGKMRQLLKTPACGSKCTQCSPLETEIYEWTEPLRN